MDGKRKVLNPALRSEECKMFQKKPGTRFASNICVQSGRSVENLGII